MTADAKPCRVRPERRFDDAKRQSALDNESVQDRREGWIFHEDCGLESRYRVDEIALCVRVVQVARRAASGKAGVDFQRHRKNRIAIQVWFLSRLRLTRRLLNAAAEFVQKDEE